MNLGNDDGSYALGIISDILSIFSVALGIIAIFYVPEELCWIGFVFGMIAIFCSIKSSKNLFKYIGDWSSTFGLLLNTLIYMMWIMSTYFGNSI